jgi:uncharacterized protein
MDTSADGVGIEQDTVETPHGGIPTTLVTPAVPSGRPPVLLAHGAGAGQNHPWMIGVRDRLAARGHRVMTFDYRYMALGRKAPDRLPVLLDVHGAVAEAFASVVGGIVLAGKSMGGRVGGHLVAERDIPALGLCYLGYPLVALGASEPRSTDHLDTIVVPQLFISGDRDRLGPIDLVTDLASRVPHGSAVVVAGGDHSLVPLKSSGRTVEDTLDGAADAMTAWMAAIAGGQAGGGT